MPRFVGRRHGGRVGDDHLELLAAQGSLWIVSVQDRGRSWPAPLWTRL
jgi:hypothetical protein